jgi:hypothetical protein
MTRLSDRHDLMPAASYFIEACRASRAHSRFAESALRFYGSHGPSVSGCVRDHFPDTVKAVLRNLARNAGDASAKAYRARPARVRESTIRKLGQEIARSHGSGFYGPQP